MQATNDIHQQFAEFFPSPALKPYFYLLSKKLSKGHVCIDLNQIDKNETLPEGYKLLLNEQGLRKEMMVGSSDEVKPIILFNNRLYLQRYFNHETIILQQIKKMIESGKEEVAQNLKMLQGHA